MIASTSTRIQKPSPKAEDISATGVPNQARPITTADTSPTAGATHGGGPILTKIGRTVRYRKADVLAWLEANSRRIERTSELAERG